MVLSLPPALPEGGVEGVELPAALPLPVLPGVPVPLLPGVAPGLSVLLLVPPAEPVVPAVPLVVAPVLPVAPEVLALPVLPSVVPGSFLLQALKERMAIRLASNIEYLICIP